ncbi:hypothetical protein I5Q34_00460 [Streptomyces sp. AV19]|uniref:hypothetical protein n=1 Tax=Streptomyces sp. AV19 TaxID=2793068 RepID=UPI0018FE7A51|nr:hypothetical protein [Streptomyces sp. AV19]MBH1932780.1 hypothetical protein [Streptomyces sp. AV19]MDG4531450.1 hypothetical protein [Streptomyces sp. AV19]
MQGDQVTPAKAAEENRADPLNTSRRGHLAVRNRREHEQRPRAVAGFFAPQPIDPAQIEATDSAERLAAYEAAIAAAQGRAEETIQAARIRFDVEVSAAMRGIASEKLHAEQYGTIEDYAEKRWGLKRPTYYEIMKAAPVMVVAMSGIPNTRQRTEVEASAGQDAALPVQRNDDGAEVVSGIPDTPSKPVLLNRQQAIETAPVLRDQGEDETRRFLADVVAECAEKKAKLTAAAIKQARIARYGDDGQERQTTGTTQNTDGQSEDGIQEAEIVPDPPLATLKGRREESSALKKAITADLFTHALEDKATDPVAYNRARNGIISDLKTALKAAQKAPVAFAPAPACRHCGTIPVQGEGSYQEYWWCTQCEVTQGICKPA